MDNSPEQKPPERNSDAPEQRPPPRPFFSTATVWFLVILTLILFLLFYTQRPPTRSEISYGFFRQQLAEENLARVRVEGQKVSGEFKDPPLDPKGRKDREGEPLRLADEFISTLPQFVDSDLDREIRENVPLYEVDEPADNFGVLLLLVWVGLAVAMFAGVWLLMRRTRDQMFGGGVLAGFTKSPAKRYESGERQITFEDVAGLEGVKHELQEIVEFLKNPERFQRLGGRVPKGVLLMGPPGTGKTLLGRAVAGEAGVPFYSISGSEFIQMFVGVGAGRVRDMFSTAKENAPCILFIDEIDAVGRHRGTGLGGGHDEREQTLNQILSEMDGFSPNESVIVMAATNRPDVLDPALLRPGRFDRHITVDRPSFKGRIALFRVHTREVPLADDVDLERLAAGTVGLTGADIRNLANEATLWATRQGKERVEMADFEYARDKILMGPKRDEVLSEKEKRITSYHEAGHALCAWVLPGIERLHKVSVMPRGRALGVTQLLPDEDRLNITETDLKRRLVFMLGGRAAEQLVFNERSAGAEDDLKRATSLARRMVTVWGMSERLGPVAFRAGEEHPFLGKEMAEHREFSEHTAQVIDEEVARLLRESDAQAQEILRDHRGQLDKLAEALVTEETLDDREIERLVGPPAAEGVTGDGRSRPDGPV